MAGRALTIDITTRDQQTLAALKRIQRELGQLDKSIETTARQGDKLGEGADEYVRKLSQAREVAGGIVLGGTTAVLGKSIKDASDLNEAMQANAATFRDSAQAVEEFASSASKIGISKKDALEATSTFGALFVQLGVGTDESAKLSTQLTTLAADFGSFKNADVTEVIEAQAAAFRGEYDALQRFVPTINAAAVEQQALAETGKASTKELTLQEKALATYTLMMEGAGPALGDFTRNQDSAANSTKQTSAELANSSSSMGQAMLPAYTQAVKVVGALAEAFQMLPGPAQTAVVGVGGLTLGVGLLAPKLMDGAKVMQAAGTKAADLAAKLVPTGRAVDGLGSTTDATTPKIGKFGVALGALGAAGVAYELIQLGRAMGETKVNAEEALGATNDELVRLAEGINALGGQGDFEKFGRQNIDSLYAMRDAVKATGQEYPALDAAIAAVEQENARAAERTDQYADAAEGAAAAASGMATEQERAAAAADRQAEANDRARSAVDAFRSAEEGVASAQDAVVSAKEQVVDAERGVAEAREAVADAARGVQDAERGLAEARQGATEAALDLAEAEREQRDGSDQLRTAQEGVKDAEENLADAQRESLATQEALNEARLTATERLEDLRRAVEELPLDEREARLRLAQAQERQAELDSESTALDREAAAIAVERAEIALREAIEEATEKRAELAEQEALGVEQSPEVVAAKDAITEAAEREKDAQGRLTEAQAAVVEAQEQMAERVVEAQARVTEANDRVREAADRVRDANDQVREAQQRVIDQQAAVVEARGAVEEAERGVTEALAEQAIKQGELNEAMGNAKGALDDQIVKLLELAGQMEPGSPVRQRLFEMAQELNALTARPWTINLVTSLLVADAGQVVGDAVLGAVEAAVGGGRATGGRIGAGQRRIVGENGPELVEGPAEVFTPAQAAARARQEAAFAERDARRAQAASGRPVEQTVNITVNEAATPYATADWITRQLSRDLMLEVAH